VLLDASGVNLRSHERKGVEFLTIAGVSKDYCAHVKSARAIYWRYRRYEGEYLLQWERGEPCGHSARRQQKDARPDLSGEYHFNTEAAEKMEIISGDCTVTLDGGDKSRTYGRGDSFDVPAKSGFTIEVTKEICEYVCSFLS
jgi:uncharacterized protein YaiE (UPF0345 family)